jgi:hypothetical protein
MTYSPQHQSEVLQDRYGLKVAVRLSEVADDLPYDILERLRAARVQALARRKVEQLRTATLVSTSGGTATLSFGDEGSGLLSRLAFALPLVALVAGLMFISTYTEDRFREVADVDAALLTDDLPPAAYTDPGFIQYLKLAGLPSVQQP